MSSGAGGMVYDTFIVLEKRKGPKERGLRGQKKNFQIDLIKLNILDVKEKH